MVVRYVDTSVLLSAYVPSEPTHALCRRLVFEDGVPITTSTLTTVDFVSGLRAADRMGHINYSTRVSLTDTFQAACYSGPIVLLEEPGPATMPDAADIVAKYEVETVGAIQLVEALGRRDSLLSGSGPFGVEPLEFVTLNYFQRMAAVALGLAIYEPS